MTIIVPIKQVPDTDNVEIDPETNNLKRTSSARINKYDRYALESALQVAEQLDDQVVAITMGPQAAEQVLVEAIGMGAARGILLSDRKFAGADTLATAYVLAKGIEKVPDIRLIILGQQAEDADTGQVGPLIAKQLDLPQATYVSAIETVTETELKVQRDFETVDVVEQLTYPALMTVSNHFMTPRYMMPSQLMNFTTDQITTWSASDLDADESRIGLAGSPSVVRRILAPQASEREAKEIKGTTVEQVGQIITILQEKGLMD